MLNLNMFKFLLVIFFTFYNISVKGICYFNPKIYTLTLDIYSCNGITIQASKETIRTGNGILLDKAGELVSGVLLRARVIENHSDLEKRKSKEYKSEWEVGNNAILFMDKEPNTFCKNTPFVKKIRIDRPCCDVFPRKGICIVPLTIGKDISE